MATTRFDLAIASASPGETKGLSDDAKQKLFRRPEVRDSKPKEAGNIIRAEAPEVAAEDEVLELEEISEAYSELIIKANGILGRLRERLKDLTYRFDPQEEPALSEALGRVFQNSTDEITYNMYLAALRLDKDVAVEIGESESGFTR